jgi:hypothetical protein
MKKKIARVISYVTVVPVVAFFIILLSFFYNRECFIGTGWIIYSIIFLTILPLLAYPLHRIIPASKKQGREGERKLAFILAVISYVLGTIITFLFNAPMIIKKIFMAYLLSGLFLSFFNKGLKIKASGHACGISGPITLLVNIIGFNMLWLYLLMPIVFWSRINLGRHTLKELFIGTFVGIVSTLAAVSLF